MTDSPYALRPEAGPVPFEFLNRSQQRAMTAIALALKEAAAQAARSEGSNHRDGMIDPNRMSTLFFVSGQPGSGKSSLYLTLRAILNKKERLSTLCEEYQAKIPDLRGLDGATIWLEQIDLEVAGDTGENLLAAVLVRIFAVLDDSSGLQSKVCQAAMDQLNDLANDIGIAWDGNLLARAPSLDPQSYSQEVMSAQRARLGTNKRLFEALTTLLKNKCYACHGETLFILPIDDFYLKPAASLELLRLLRMISVPNLFFLIMGDIKTMEALFFEKALADWTEVAGPEVFASLETGKKDEILSRVREMKARYLRKLLPVGQRATIEWTSWDEALRYKPTVTDSSGDVSTLSRLLSAVPLKSLDQKSTIPNNLLNYLVAPNYSDDNDPTDDNGPDYKSEEKAKYARNRIKTYREAYSALQILDATPREVADLWMCLSELKERKQDHDEKIPPYLWTVVDSALIAIEEQDFLTEQQQDSVRYAFPTSHKDDLLIETRKFLLASKSSPRLDIACDDVFIRKHLDWKLGISNTASNKSNQGFNEHGSSPKHLPPRTAAWIVLLHDLAWDWQQSSLTRNLIHQLLTKIKTPDVSIALEENQPSMEHAGWAWYIDKQKWVHFPLPCVSIFRQLDRFLVIWSDGLTKVHDPIRLDGVVNLWGLAAWIVNGTEDRYLTFVNDQSFSEDQSLNREEKDNLNGFRERLFRPHRFLIPFVNRGVA